MKKAQAVIGAGYGDEGKGLVTDYLAAQTGPDTLVIRFNGGAQAGHTVTTPDGRRHIFGHIGSGTFIGCPTFLSRFFVVNPLVFASEYQELVALNAPPTVWIDPRSPVTTPYDMIINQAVEQTRGAARHGSCGLGFGETVARHSSAGFQLSFADLVNKDFVRTHLATIRHDWVPRRFKALGFDALPKPWDSYCNSDILVERFLADVETLRDLSQQAPLDFLRTSRSLLFEGAQGLLLDPAYGHFPHVTRSATGLRNILTLAAETDLDAIEPFYITRAYRTRHGAGPLDHETEGPVYQGISDPTNIPNPFQGSLRFGLLDLDVLRRSVRQDVAQASAPLQITPRPGLTCLDQIDDQARFICAGTEEKDLPKAFINRLSKHSGLGPALTSWGPTRTTIRII